MASTNRNRKKNFSSKTKLHGSKKKCKQSPGPVQPIKCSVTGREAFGPPNRPVRGKRQADGSGRLAPTGAVWQ